MIKVGFIGAGTVAGLHAKALAEGGAGQLAGVWSRSHANAERFADQYGGTAHDSAEALLAQPDIEAVFILNASEAHADLALRSLEAGKHVLIEKPVGVTRGEVRRIRDAARASDRVCMPSHNYIYAPEVRRIHAHLTSGRLGRLNSFWALYNQRLPPEVGRPDPAMGGPDDPSRLRPALLRRPASLCRRHGLAGAFHQSRHDRPNHDHGRV
ncbi:MAG: Gfo/Idh/MocA family oxidoreductase [Pseudomonadota bacterium]